MDQPLISIILPVYNGERFLAEAIESCLNQTYSKLELIIVDDCSRDNTKIIAEEYANKDSRIKIVSNSENKKLPASLNIGHDLAIGDLITWTSHDNLYQREALEQLMGIMDRCETDIVYSNYLIINDSGSLTGVSRLKDIEYLLFDGIIGACFLYKKEVYIRNQRYNENLFLVEDHDFWLRALEHSTFCKIDNPGLYFYRYHPDALTTKIKSDPETRKLFLNSLHSLYNNLFNKEGLKNKEILVKYLINRYENGPYSTKIPFQYNSFFNELKLGTNSLKGFSSDKLNMIIFKESIEGVMRNRKSQNLSTLIAIHMSGMRRILHLPIDRYLALIKKCLT